MAKAASQALLEPLAQTAGVELAEACFAEAAAMQTAAGDPIHAARSRVSHGVVLHLKGRTTAALDLHRELAPIFRRACDRPWLARVINNEGVFLETLGHAAEAVLAYEEAAALHLAHADRAMAAASLLNKAEVLLDARDAPAAAAQMDEAAALLAAVPAPPAWILNYRDRLMQRAHPTESAR
jgi:hypothetical protein